MSSLDLSPLTPPEPSGGDAGQQARMPEPGAAAPAGEGGAAAASALVTPEVQAQLRRNAEAFVQAVLALDPRSPEMLAQVRHVEQMGAEEIAQSTQLSRRMLDRKARSGSVGRRQGGPDQVAADALVSLRSEVEDLDPADLDKPARKVLGFLPGGDRVADYLERYRAGQDRITMLVLTLRRQQDELRKDTAAIAGEQTNLGSLVQALQGYVVLAGEIDAALERALASGAATDADRAAVLRDQVLRAVRTRHQDLLTHLAVCQQGILALDVVRSTNDLLVTAIDRAATTTLAALRTAVVVTDALASQRRALDTVGSADRAAGAVREGTVADLRAAFGEARAALDGATAAREQGVRDETAAARALEDRTRLG